MSGTLVADYRPVHDVAMVCCHCRKVRTPTGEWEAATPRLPRVSHGICRACLTTYYPDVVPPPEVR
ncbi:MAG: hypothetical protein JWO38_3851 [Gemmataceae bacterium]|nr:hypothetical protein [Gemmataceae bacterium]